MPGNPDLIAIVDPARCEAKAACIAVCPTEALQLEPLPPDVRAGLSFFGRVKAWVHGNRWAAVSADRCEGCGLCVPICPERAIRVRLRSAVGAP